MTWMLPSDNAYSLANRLAQNRHSRGRPVRVCRSRRPRGGCPLKLRSSGLQKLRSIMERTTGDRFRAETLRKCIAQRVAPEISAKNCGEMLTVYSQMLHPWRSYVRRSVTDQIRFFQAMADSGPMRAGRHSSNRSSRCAKA
jgi:hypothetical protein